MKLKCQNFNVYLGHQLTKVATPGTWLYWPMKIKLATFPINSQKASIKADLLVVVESFIIHFILRQLINYETNIILENF